MQNDSFLLQERTGSLENKLGTRKRNPETKRGTGMHIKKIKLNLENFSDLKTNKKYE